MLRISEEDYRDLEMKIQVEVRKILAQFLEDLEQKYSTPDEMPTTRELKKSRHLPEHGAIKAPRTPGKPGKRRTSKKSEEINRMLKGTPQPDRKSPAQILEDDMDKIFRKRNRQ